MEQKWWFGIWGAVLGAIAIAIVGFSWWGWTTASNAKVLADEAALKVLVRVCAEKLAGMPDAVAALKTKAERDWDDVVRDYLKDTAVFSFPTNFSFRGECGRELGALVAKTAAK
jgi:hypothetical protein